MIKPKYVGNFNDRESVAREYEHGVGERWDTSKPYTPAEDFPTDNQILYASYEQESYEGSSFVLFKRGGKLYEVNGSHCSCMGLEGQWKPEETTWEALAIRQPSSYGAPEAVVVEAKKRIKSARKVNAVGQR